MSPPSMFEIATDAAGFDAVAMGLKRHVTLVRMVGIPSANDAIRVVEARDGLKTGRACFARVLFVERVSDEVSVLSIEVRMSTDRMPAVRG